MSELEEGELSTSEDETRDQHTNGQSPSSKRRQNSDIESGEITDSSPTGVNYDDEDVSVS